MRILFLLLFITLVAQPVITKAQSVKEMQEKMQGEIKKINDKIADLEKQIVTAKKENPEGVEGLQKKLAQQKQQLAMMEQAMKGVAKMPATLIQKAEADDKDDSKNEIPKKDFARIKLIPDKILTDTELAPFLQKVNTDVEKKISAEDKTQAAQLYNEFKTQFKSSVITGHLASACWMKGFPEIALYVIGKVCRDDMKNTDNLNNYAAFLTMAGAEQSALPILQNLNVKFPGNSTILNNIGQAWFGLGDINKAKLYLDSTISVSRHHSKANETKSKIEKAEGKTEDAVKSIKESIKEAYSSEKEAALTEMGEKLQYEDVSWKYPKPFEPFGLEKFLQVMPAYPMSLLDAEYRNEEWLYFREQLSKAAAKLDKEIEELKEKVDAYEDKLRNVPGQHPLLKPYNNPVYKKANRKLMLLAEWGIDKQLRIAKKFDAARDTIKKMKEIYREAIRIANMSNENGCAMRNAAILAFIGPANIIWHDIQLEKIRFEKQYLGEEISYASYSAVDKTYFEWGKAKLKRQFVTMLMGLNYEFEKPCEEEEKPEKEPGKKKLPDFDDVNCNYREEISIPFSKYTIECNKITWEFNAQFLKIKHSTDLNTGKTLNGSIEIGAFKDVPGSIPFGPLTVEAVVEGAVSVEFDDGGITDVAVKAGAKVQVGVNVSPESKTGMEIHTEKLGPVGIYEVTSLHAAELVGMHARMAWNAGFSASGKTVLGGGHH